MDTFSYINFAYPYSHIEVARPRAAIEAGPARKSLRIAKILGVLGAVLVISSAAPKAYSVFRGDTVSNNILETAQRAESAVGVRASNSSEYAPAFDPTLPKGVHLSIPSIGVKTSIHEAPVENYEDALKKGIWRVSDFGTPASSQRPTILAAHRFGYLKWDNDFRRRNSFYNLPEMKKGDTVEIIWNQRRYVYAVYASEKGEQITDYSADLILYTCNDLLSDTRVIQYLKLLEV